MDEPEELQPETLDPRELEALQRDLDHALSIDAPSPENVAAGEVPAAAEQPAAPVAQPLDPTEDLKAPEIDAPAVDEVMRSLAEELPPLDIPSTPPAKKPNAWQKRHGQVARPAQPMPVPAPAQKQPNQQPPQELPAAEDLKAVLAEARRIGAVDEHEQVVGWNRMLGQDNGQRLGNADANVDDLRDAQKDNDERNIAIFTTMIELHREQSGRLQRIEIELKRILNGMERSRG